MSAEETHMALSLNNVSVGYQKTAVAEAISFDIAEGELLAIIGINGIGKSTLLRTLGKVQPKLSGAIKVKGKALENYKSEELASKISMVLTEAIVSKNMTVKELVALGRHPYTNWLGSLSAVDRSKIKEAISLLELEPLQDKKCYELSDGQLQRAMIARAVAQDTPIMLLDEPTTHLDLYHKVTLLKLLLHIAHTTKKAIVITSHEIEMVLQLCDKMLLLDGVSNPFGAPKSLIQDKAFEKLFPTDTVTFDPETAAFRILK